MPISMTAPSRVVLLLSLISYLQDRGPTPILELADTFGVEPKVLRGLAEFLGTAGVPGETQTYQHEDLFDIDWYSLEHEDILSLVRVVAIDDTPRFAASETAVLLAGLHVIAPMLPEADAAAARSAAEKLGGEESGELAVISLSRERVDQQVEAVARAITGNLRLGFDYRDAGGGASARVVEPLVLSQSGEFWYLRGFCLDRDEERSFRLDRMSRVNVLDVVAQRRPSRSQIEGVTERGEWTGTKVTLRVRTRVLPRLAGYGVEVFEADAPAPRDLPDLALVPDGWVRASVELAHVNTAPVLAAIAPGDIIVEAPAAARDAVTSWAQQALAQYDD